LFIVLQLDVVQVFTIFITFPILDGFMYGFHGHLGNV